MDQQLLGEATVKLMESLEKEGKFDDAEIIAVGIVVILAKDDAEEGGPFTYTRTYSTEDIHFRAVGLFREGLQTVESRHIQENDPDEIEEDEEEDGE
jgi:hypothetical protein